MNSRSASVDTSENSLPPAHTGSALRRVARQSPPRSRLGLERPRAGAQLRKTRLRGSWEAAGPREWGAFSLPSSPKRQGAPGSGPTRTPSPPRALASPSSGPRRGRGRPHSRSGGAEWASAGCGAGTAPGARRTGHGRRAELPEAISAGPGSTSPPLPLSRPPRPPVPAREGAPRCRLRATAPSGAWRAPGSPPCRESPGPSEGMRNLGVRGLPKLFFSSLLFLKLTLRCSKLVVLTGRVGKTLCWAPSTVQ